MSIKIDTFQTAVSAILEDYTEDVRDAVDLAVTDTGKQALKTVRVKSPKKSGEYRKGWTSQKNKDGPLGRKVFVTIYNKKHYQRIHLLEHGHQKPQGGRVEGVPHVQPTEEEAQRLLPQNILRNIKEIGE